MIETTLASISAEFTWVDWGVVVVYLAFTTFLGAALAGKQSSMRDFFLGGRKLPWYAVSGSIIATEISALTFIGVPYVVFKDGGNFTYLQLGAFGSLFARIIVGYVLVPAYYKREIYSPYDYMGNKLGGYVRSMTTVLFSFGGMLAQSARVYLTAVVLMVVMRDQLVGLEEYTSVPALAWAIFFIGAVSVGWTLIGGITTVIWTDVILFLVFLLGAVVALITVATELDGGIAEIFRVGWNAKESGPWGKFTFFDFDTSPIKDLTIWTAVIASTWGGLGAYGTDQLLAQRMFCCKDEKDARWAIISSTIGQVVTLTVMLVGVGLFAYYRVHELEGDALALFNEKGDSIFPIFIVQVIPMGLKGLIIAGVFAAAISSLMGILTALSQVVMSAFYNPLRERHLRKMGIDVNLSGNIEELAEKGEASDEDKRSVFVGRLMVVFWGAVLCIMAYIAESISRHYPSILQLGLAMAGYAGGALLAGFALAFLPLRITGRGFMFSGPLSLFCIVAMVWHQPWTVWFCIVAGTLLLVAWIWFIIWESGSLKKRGAAVLPVPLQTFILIAGIGLMFLLNQYCYFLDAKGNAVPLAWPWWTPVGSVIAFFFGYLLSRKSIEAEDAQ